MLGRLILLALGVGVGVVAYSAYEESKDSPSGGPRDPLPPPPTPRDDDEVPRRMPGDIDVRDLDPGTIIKQFPEIAPSPRMSARFARAFQTGKDCEVCGE